jgi:hypothetical protein
VNASGLRLALFPLGIIAALGSLYIFLSGYQTLQRLNTIEAVRDQWQRPSEIVAALDGPR